MPSGPPTRVAGTQHLMHLLLCARVQISGQVELEVEATLEPGHSDREAGTLSTHCAQHPSQHSLL